MAVVLDMTKLLLILGQGRKIYCIPWLSWLLLIKALKKLSSFKYVLKYLAEIVNYHICFPAVFAKVN